MPRLHVWNLTTPEGHDRWARWRMRVVAWEVGRENAARRPRAIWRRNQQRYDWWEKRIIHPHDKRPDTRLRLLGRAQRAVRHRWRAICLAFRLPFDKRLELPEKR